MPDDLAGLAEEIEKELNMVRRVNEQDYEDEVAAPLPEARTVPKVASLEALARAWVKWLPVSIIFCGLAFCGWMVIQVITVGRYHDALGQLEHRVKVLEDELVKAKEGEAVEYWVHQCEVMARRGDFNDIKP